MSASQKSLPPPEWLYDRLMLAIEPELTTAQMPYLDEKYRGESDTDRTARMQRYSAAFATFGTMLQEFGNYLFEQTQVVMDERRTQRTSAEAQEQQFTQHLADELFGDEPQPS